MYDIVLCVYERFRVDGLKRYVNDDRFRVDGDKNMRLLAFAFTIVFVWTGPHKDAHGSWILFYITCSLVNNAFSVLHYVIKVTLHYLTFHRFGIHSTGLVPRSLLSCRVEAARWQLCSKKILKY